MTDIEMLKKEKKRSIEKDFRPVTLDEFYKRINQSMLDSKNGKLTSVDELIKEIDEWG